MGEVAEEEGRGVGGRGFCGPNASNPVILRETALLKASEAGDMRIARRGGGGVSGAERKVVGKEGRGLEG